MIHKYIKRILIILLIILIFVGIGKVINIKVNNEINNNLSLNVENIKELVESKKYEEAIKKVEYSFFNLKKRQYNYQYKNVWNMLIEIINIPEGRRVAIKILSKMENSKYINKETELYVVKSLKILYILENNNAKSTEYILKTISIAKKNNKKYDEVKSIIELGMTYSRIDGEEKAIELISDSLKMKLEDNAENAYLKAYAYINLADIYFKVGEIDKSKEAINNIKTYKKYLKENDYRDFETLIYILNSRIYSKEGNLDKSKEFLEHAKLLISVDTDILMVEKDILYSIGEGEYYYEKKDYYKAKSIYEELLSTIGENSYYQKLIISKLIDVSREAKLRELEEVYKSKMIEIQNEFQDKVSEDYSYYIMEQYQNSNLLFEYNKEMKKIYLTIIFLLISLIAISPFIYKKIISIKYVSMYDGLTGVLNRMILDKRYYSMINKNKNFYVIIYDIDNFKNINDTYGHHLGDIVLINTSKLINNMLSKGESLYRYGGEEFVILVEGRSKDYVINLAESIRLSIEYMNFKENIKVTASFGIANSIDFSNDTIKKADDNLYIAKKSGKNKVIF